MAPARKKQRISGDKVALVGATTDLPGESSSTVADESKTPAEKDEAQQKRSLFVRALPPTTTTESLTELFSQSYPIKHATAVIDPSTKQCRGYGFITFADAEDAAAAKKEFNGHVVDGRKLRVELAEPRQREGEGEKKPIKQAREPELAPKLIVRNLPWSIKKPEHLSKLFLSYGKVKSAYIPTKGPGLMSGFGFVIMRGKKNAEKAIEGVNGKDVDGRTIAVDWAVDKTIFKGTDGEEDGGEGMATEDALGEEEDAEEDADDLMAGVGAEEESDMEGEAEASEGSGVDLDDEERMESDDEEEAAESKQEDRSSTVFIRNLPFTCTDEDLEDHFAQFGSTRYARVVMDPGTERSKGTGFVCFYKKEDADECVKNAPRQSALTGQPKAGKDGKNAPPSHSILQNDMADPSGNYTLDSRVLQVTRAVDKREANRLTEEGMAQRNHRDKDKRRLYLLSEGTLSSKSKLWEMLSKSERDMRDASLKQRKKLIESNPSLHLSLTRLSVRNIPRSVTSKDLKGLARDAVVGFASDVKAGQRERLSKEELSRAGEAMQAAERLRKKSGKGIVKQAKVVFEGASGSKVHEDSGAGRSRGYGFIEYHTHRNALMGLRWLNGHAVGSQAKAGAGKPSLEDVQDRKKRLIVEFAIENAQVVLRRKESEQKARERSHVVQQGLLDGSAHGDSKKLRTKEGNTRSGKRKRGSSDAQPAGQESVQGTAIKSQSKEPVNEKLARRNQIIGRKRAMRRARQGTK